MNGGSLHARNFSSTNLCNILDTDLLKMALRVRKVSSFRDFRETGSSLICQHLAVLKHAREHVMRLNSITSLEFFFSPIIVIVFAVFEIFIK